MKPTIKIIEIKAPPQLKHPAMQQGIRDKAGALAWAEKNGHAVVYFLARKQRVYAERLATQVHKQAGKIQKASAQLAEEAEMWS